MRSLGRPAGYADTPLDDQQRDAGTLCCSMLLLDKSVCTPDAQCNVKMCALDESLQRMYDITSPKAASPRRNTLANPLSLYIYIYIYIYHWT